ESHLEEDVVIIAKGIPDEDVIEIRHPEDAVLQIGVPSGGNEDLAERKGHALTELIFSLDGGPRESRLHVVSEQEPIHFAVIIRRISPLTGEVGVDVPNISGVKGCRFGDLLLDPAFKPNEHDTINTLRVRSEA